MEQAALQRTDNIPAWPAYLWRMLRHPLKAGAEIARWETLRPGLVVVLVLGLYLALGSLRSYLNRDYPPPPEELRVWIDTWGEFAMLPLPFLPIALDQYRLFMAIISLPVAGLSWLVMAGVARGLGRRFGVPTGWRAYLNLFAFSFYPFWLLSALGDWFYSAALQPYTLPGLRGEYGALAQAFFTNFPPLLYTLLFGLGAIYNGLAAYGAAQAAKRLRWWQAALIGWATFLLPLVLVATLYR